MIVRTRSRFHEFSFGHHKGGIRFERYKSFDKKRLNAQATSGDARNESREVNASEADEKVADHPWENSPICGRKSRFSSIGKKLGNLEKSMFPVQDFVYYTKTCVGMGSHGWKCHVCQPRSCVCSSNSEYRLIWHPQRIS